jgi:hypothetical protein
MTVAICFKCGAMKFGAFTPCEKCNAVPEKKDDFKQSILLTSHYFQNERLKDLGAKIEQGLQLQFELTQEMEEQIEASMGLMKLFSNFSQKTRTERHV